MEIIFALYPVCRYLNAEGMAYEGMAYRKAIDKLEKDTIGIFADKQVVFIGLMHEPFGRTPFRLL
jgi:hypothetical protein